MRSATRTSTAWLQRLLALAAFFVAASFALPAQAESCTTEGTRQCVGSSQQVCTGGEWIVTACTYGCYNGFCNSCTPGARRCSGSYAQTCSATATGYTWQNLSSCTYGCYNGYCNQCTPGTRRCSGDTQQVCTAAATGYAWDDTACTEGCSNGYCNECSEGDRTCSGDTAQTCDTSGTYNVWSDTSTCTYGCYDGYCNTCTPDTWRCSGDVRMRCDATATGYDWNALTTCSYGDGCYMDGSEAKCHCEFNAFNRGDYVDGDVVCYTNGTLYHCTATGVWTVSGCPFGCDGGDTDAQCACGPGTYDTGSDCADCTAGTYQDQAGATVCLDCPYGTYQNQTGGTECLYCQAGTYQDQPASTVCLDCQVGTYQSMTGSTSCFSCPTGSYQDQAASTACLECPSDTYQDQFGATQCIDCPQDTTAPAGSDEASDCATPLSAPTVGVVDFSPRAASDVGTDAFVGQLMALSLTVSDDGGSPVTGYVWRITPPGQSATQYATSTATYSFEADTTGQWAVQAAAINAVGTSALVSPKDGADADEPIDVGGVLPPAIASFVADDPDDVDAVYGAGDTLTVTFDQTTDLAGLGTSVLTKIQVDTLLTASTPLGLDYTGQWTDASTFVITVVTPAALPPTIGVAAVHVKAAAELRAAGGLSLPSESVSSPLAGNWGDGSGACSVGYYDTGSGCEACPVGQYQNQAGATVCLECPTGTYQNQTGSTVCLGCPVGTYGDSAGASACAACDAGKYQDQFGATTCLDCGVGTFSNVTGNTMCYDCPQGRYQPQTGSTVCLTCPADTYQDQFGATVCLDCPAGTSAPVGSDSQDDCEGSVSCNPGFYDGGSGCEACPAGKYQNVAGATACLDCPGGTYQSETGATACLACDAGKYQDQVGASACMDCMYGSYQDQAGATQCLMCPTGKYQDQFGATTCLDCGVGTFMNVTGMAMCYDCAQGSYQPQTGSTVCLTCPADTYQDQFGATVCLDCPAGTSAPVGSDSQDDCEGSVSCNPGFYDGGSGCEACPAGKYQNVAGATACLDCPGGTYQSETGATACLTCDAGKYQDQVGASACMDCMYGSYQDQAGATQCLMCPTGKYQDQFGATTCLDCGVGTFSNVTGNTMCYDCPQGGYQPQTGSTVCLTCPADTYQDQFGATVCLDCPAGTSAPVGSDSQDDCEGSVSCNPGFYDGGSGCEACPAGKYQNVAGATACLDCPGGTYQSETGATACLTCDAGKYQDIAGSTICLDCPTGAYTGVVGSTVCLDCAAGTFANETGATACLDCPVGTFQGVAGEAACQYCNPGGYQDQAGATVCLTCPGDTYQDQFGATACLDCPAGTSAPAGSDAPDDCVTLASPPTIGSVDFTPRAAGDVGLDAFLGQLVTLTATVTDDGGSPVVSYTWVLTPPGLQPMVQSSATGTLSFPADSGGAWSVQVAAVNAVGAGVSMTPVDGSGNPETIDVGSALPPAIDGFVASDPDDGDAVYGAGDMFTVSFDQDTNRAGYGAGPLTKTDIDALLTMTTPLGNDYLGQWLDGQTLVLTVVVPAALPPAVGVARVSVRESAGLRVADGQSLPSSAVSPALSGNFGDGSGTPEICLDGDATLTLTAPATGARVELGYDGWTAEETGSVTLTLSTVGAEAGDTLLVRVDDAPAVNVALSATHELTDLAAGAHTAGVQLADASGVPYCGVSDVVRFYLSRVCLDDSHCADDDACTIGQCINDPTLTGWTGRCRFGLDSADPDCCVNDLWCDALNLSFGDAGLGYTCADIDADGQGDCVQCRTAADCALTSVCEVSASCVANECVYLVDPGCCEDDLDCDDGLACTTDSCDTDTNACVFAPIEGCCIAGNEDELPGADTYGCTAADAHPCLRFVCIGQGAEAECKQAQLWSQCCAEDADCAEARLLTACVDPSGQGYARCATETPTAIDGAFHCDYGPVAEDCCTHDWQCADRYPVEIGSCTGDAGDYHTCEYAANPDYCASPVTGIVISEIMVNTPALGDPAGEWIELFNPTAVDIDIEGWTVRQDEAGTQMFTIDTLGDSLVVPAGGFVTLAASGAAEINGGFEPDYVYDAAAFRLDDTDAIGLYDDEDALQDLVAWDLWLLWGNSASMALVHPYLDNALADSWARSSLVYGRQAGTESLGTPGGPNRDVFDSNLTTGLACDDGQPCTLDLCNYTKAAQCSHLPLFDCCTAPQSRECNDYNRCTEDSCDVATNACQHLVDPACCLTDEDCLGVYPDSFDTVAEQTAFDQCTDAVCVGGQCRFGRDRTNPGCCVTTDAELGLGCSDRNSCTTDLCADQGSGYPQCTYDADPLDDPDVDDGDECCFTSADCDDGDAATIDLCARVDFADDAPHCPGVSQSQCCHQTNPLYCGDDADCDDGLACTDDACVDNGCEFTPVASAESCCESHAQCSDGDACTTDYCCVGADDPIVGCAGPHTCASEPLEDATCCDSHDDCRGINAPPEMFCRAARGYCIGGACRYGPPTDALCCVTEDDCPQQDCTTWTCATNQCQATPIDDCCETVLDCPAPSGDCVLAACINGACAELELPNCCVDTNGAQVPDADCADADPCTTDYCVDVGDKFQCRHVKTGGAGCCATSATCPDDHVQCTDRACSDEHACELMADATCALASPYEMSFDEGHAIYAGEYASVDDLAWTLAETGTEALDAASWSFDSGTLLGPDQYLRLLPVGRSLDYESCLVLPPMSTLGGFWWAELSFSYAADLLGGALGIEVRVAVDGDWANAEPWGAPIAIGADTPETAYSTGRLNLPLAVGDSADTQFAICVLGADTDLLMQLGLDDLTLEKFNSR